VLIGIVLPSKATLSLHSIQRGAYHAAIGELFSYIRPITMSVHAPGTAHVSIRRAIVTDAVVIAAVLREAFVPYQSAYTPAAFSATTPADDQIRQRLLEGPIWVAVDDQTTVGTLSAVQRGATIYLRSLAVLPTSHGRGLGRLLIEQAERFAAERTASHLLLSTTPFLTHAIQLYEQLGFRPTTDGPQELFGTPLITMVKMVTSAE
jgi:GNAT superfamily N-acetyltransferase